MTLVARAQRDAIEAAAEVHDELLTLRRLVAAAYSEDMGLVAWAGHEDRLESLAETYEPDPRWG